ncbi:MAG: hypothetical protein HQ559_13700 [Lentisphaerae bacterium]|nr:hypothetical protein [Lentisphaerota bacterium]
MPIFPYRLWSVVLGSGPLGLVGWLALFAIPAFGVLSILKRAGQKPVPMRTRFFGVAHVCFLLFLLNVVVQGSAWSHPSETLLSLSIGITTALVSTCVVALCIRTKPQPDFWSCLGITCVATSVALFAAGMLVVIHWKG